ncbi:MAG: hypothetical protein ABL921_30565, partial [Pirellula sp.]
MRILTHWMIDESKNDDLDRLDSTCLRYEMLFNQTISKMLEPRRIGSIHCWKISPLGLAWMYLALAVVSEVCGLTLMKLSVSTGRVEGFVAF